MRVQPHGQLIIFAINCVCRRVSYILYILLGGDNIQYVYTDSNHADPLQRIVPVKLISSEEEYDRAKYLDMLFDSAEAVLSVLGFNRSLYGIDNKTC